MSINSDQNSLYDSKPSYDTLNSDEWDYQFIRLYKRMIELKAMIFFVVTLFSLAYLYSQIYIRARLSDFDRWIIPNFWTFDQVFYIFSSIFCLVSIVSCLVVLMPNFKNLVTGSVFFNKNAKYQSQQKYVSVVLNKVFSGPNEDKLTTDLANITSRKNNAFRLSLWSGILCVCLIVIMNLV